MRVDVAACEVDELDVVVTVQAGPGSCRRAGGPGRRPELIAFVLLCLFFLRCLSFRDFLSGGVPRGRRPRRSPPPPTPLRSAAAAPSRPANVPGFELDSIDGHMHRRPAAVVRPQAQHSAGRSVGEFQCHPSPCAPRPAGLTDCRPASLARQSKNGAGSSSHFSSLQLTGSTSGAVHAGSREPVEDPLRQVVGRQRRTLGLCAPVHGATDQPFAAVVL